MRATIFALMLCVAASGIALPQEIKEQPRPRSISVRGQGTLTTIPDQVRLSVQVSVRSETASGAMTETSKRTKDVLAILKGYGVDEKDIQTARVTVTAIFDYEKRIQPPPIIGYTGTNDFSILFKGKLMEKVGDFMDKAVTAGVSNFGGLQYESSRQRELERDALKSAALDAQARAEVLAKELAATLGRVMNVSETMGAVPGPLGRGMMMADATTAPVLAGQLTITAHVDVVFELK